jgi:hypothetical protein
MSRCLRNCGTLKINTVLTKFNTVLTKKNTILAKFNTVLTKKNTLLAKFNTVLCTWMLAGGWGGCYSYIRFEEKHSTDEV